MFDQIGYLSFEFFTNQTNRSFLFSANLKIRSNSKDPSFLSKLYKFELLSASAASSSDTKGVKKEEEEKNNEMPIITRKQRNRIKKPTRSKSIGCEEDLKTLIKNKKLYFKQIKEYLQELRLKKNELTSSTNELLKSPLFLHIQKNLIHFIDDDDDIHNEETNYLLSASNQQQNEKIRQKQFNLMNLNQQKDSSKSGNNIQKEEYDDEDYSIKDDDIKMTSKSVPNSPRLFLRNSNSNKNSYIGGDDDEEEDEDHEKNEKEEKSISFVYNVDLYTERNNLDLLDFEQEKENIEAAAKKKAAMTCVKEEVEEEGEEEEEEEDEEGYDDKDELSIKLLLNKTLSNSSSRSSSLSSLHKLVNKQLEPLEINEVNKIQEQAKEDQNDSIPLAPSSSSSSVESSSSNSAQIASDSTTESSTVDVKLDSKSTDSLGDSYLNEGYKNDKQEKIIVSNNEDFDDDSMISLSESQMYLKENYEKAKKERQLEEETAAQEQQRLQVIEVKLKRLIS